MPTHIKLQDGVRDGGHVLDHLTLRDFQFDDIFAMAVADFSKLSDALKMIARLSGASLDDLCLLTQDDTIIALNAFDEHILKFNEKAGL
jgi:hypothetical protein